MKVSTFVKHAELVKRRLTKLSELVSKFTADQLTPAQLQTLHTYETDAKRRFGDFGANLDKLVNTDPLPDDYDDDMISFWQDDVSDLYTGVVSQILDLTLSQGDTHNTSITSTSRSEATSSVRLPKLNLPEFSGDTRTWLNFHGLFESTIHQNSALTPLEKFQYLLSSLRGEALGVIKSLPLTIPNYKIAWELLEKRYHNTRRLVNFHIGNILDLPAINSLSTKHLRNFVSVFAENQQALAALGHDLSQDSVLLVNLLTRKLDLNTRKKFEDSRGEAENVPAVKDLMRFLESECRHLEDATIWTATNQNPVFVRPNAHSTYKQDARPVVNPKAAFITTSVAAKPVQCWFCPTNNHNIYNCQDFQKKSPQERHALVKVKGYCYNCLSTVHTLKVCKSIRTCNKCHKRHHTLLHLDAQLQSSSDGHFCTPITTPPIGNTPGPSSTTFVGLSSNQRTSVLLATTIAHFSTPNGLGYAARGILDSASQSSFVSERLAQLMGARRWHISEAVNGVSLAQVRTKGLTYFNVSSVTGSIVVELHPFTILNDITAFLPHCNIAPDVKCQFKNLVLADPFFDTPGNIDFLIGADLYGQIFTGHRYVIGHGLPVAFSTVFGYVLMGPAPVGSNAQSHPNEPVALLTTSSSDLHQSLQRFWEMEELPNAPIMSLEDKRCEEHFLQTHARDHSGRYMVRLPLKEDPPPLADSRAIAEHQFMSLERRMSNQPHFRQMYVQVINDYLTSHHMEKVLTSHELPARHYFLPHHGVVKDSSSTPLRIVFNASAKTKNNISLNDCLDSGPKLQATLVDVITHFRRHQIAFMADIKQMYRQIMVHPEDQYLQLLLWRNHSEEPVQVYKLTRVVFGMASSPFLALRCLKQLIADEGHNYPQAAEILQSCTFVDDVLGGSSTLEEALVLQEQLVSLLLKGGFELRKWTSNSTQLLESLPQEYHEVPIALSGSEQPSHSILGLQWESKSDTFSYKVRPFNTTLTKRTILSNVAKLYDPCGWLTPVTFWAKALIQSLWTLGLSWDEAVPLDIARRWTAFSEDLPGLSSIAIARLIDVHQDTQVELHGFGDASEAGYAAVIYLRANTQGKVRVSLLMAKSRVAPLKRLSLPRLELCAAHMVAKLLHYCSGIIAPYCSSLTIHAWCDSTIALAWIRTPSYRLKVFVANRVSEIQDLVAPHHWLHIASSENPADCASRGLYPSELVNHPLWWTGPKWLVLSLELRPVSVVSHIRQETLPEMKLEPVHSLVTTTDDQPRPLDMLLETYSSWTKLINVFAYILRFINYCRTSLRYATAHLSYQELQDTTLVVCKLVQGQQFAQDIKLLKDKKNCSTRLQRLAPFLDDQGVIRVGGRLRHANIKFSSKHPVILPKSHHVVTMIIDYYHLKHLHAGPQLLQAVLCDQFWILNARNQIRSRVFKCVTCFRTKPKPHTPFMGDLPNTRVAPTRPFSKTGMDYAGPFHIKIHKLRRAQLVKVYLCIFVCFVTKAIHIEIVTDLTSETFIAALTRFVARRGLCSDLYSDCGTNFIGAATKLRKIFRTFFSQKENQDAITQFANRTPINFHFLPPAAPHMGGLWESAVKSAKHHLTRVLGQYVPTFEEFLTLTNKVEAMLNSRPLTPLSSDPSDLGVLTPGHFMIGAPLIAVPEPSREDIPINRLTRWQTIEAFSQRIWQRWHKEYLHTLQQRGKWTRHTPNLKLGDLVLVHNHRVTPLYWPLGRIIKTFPGQDGVVRTVRIRTATGELDRPSVKVFPLPIS